MKKTATIRLAADLCAEIRAEIRDRQGLLIGTWAEDVLRTALLTAKRRRIDRQKHRANAEGTCR
jgi:hypothetical protein